MMRLLRLAFIVIPIIRQLMKLRRQMKTSR